jgi:hypothetical protein
VKIIINFTIVHQDKYITYKSFNIFFFLFESRQEAIDHNQQREEGDHPDHETSKSGKPYRTLKTQKISETNIEAGILL